MYADSEIRSLSANGGGSLPGGRLSSLHHALDILEVLGERGPEVSLSEVAAAAGIGKSGAHKILQNLQSRGYVRQGAVGGGYSLGLATWRLGARCGDAATLAAHASPVLERLTAATAETSHVVIRDASEIVYLARAETQRAVKAYGNVGDRAPAQCVATGKVLLAALPWREVDALLPPLLPAITPTSVTDRELLREELRRVGTLGYAFNRGEWRADVNGIAVLAGRAPSGVPIAIGISAPAYRFPDEAALSLLPRLTEAAEELKASWSSAPARGEEQSA